MTRKEMIAQLEDRKYRTLEEIGRMEGRGAALALADRKASDAALLSNPNAPIPAPQKTRSQEDAERDLLAVESALQKLQQQEDADQRKADAARVEAARAPHRAEVVAAVKAAIEASTHLASARKIRHGLPFGQWSPSSALPDVDGWQQAILSLTDWQSSLCFFVRECVAKGYLTGSEPFLAAVRWQIP